VSRDGSEHTYAFRATLDSQVVPAVAIIPALGAGAGAPRLTIGLAPETAAQYAGIGTADVKATFSATNPITGATFDLLIEEETTVNNWVPTDYTNVTSPLVHTTGFVLKSSGTHPKRIRLTVQYKDGDNVAIEAQRIFTFNAL
jgi:hypothetical protein